MVLIKRDTNILFAFLYILFQYYLAPVVFVSKMLGMLPAIWTEEESESECKSYFNLYTFVIFAGGLALVFLHHLNILNQKFLLYRSMDKTLL